jgi:SPOR domain
MRFKLALLLTTFSLLSPGATSGAQRDADAQSYTIQVGSFSDSAQAQQLVTRVRSFGERATTAAVSLAGRGRWTRVFVGYFPSVAAARAHAEHLLRSGLIEGFLIRAVQEPPKEPAALINQKARSADPANLTARSSFHIAPYDRATPLNLPGTTRNGANLVEASRIAGASDSHSLASRGDQRPVASGSLPVVRRLTLALAPGVDTRLLTRPDPVRLAFTLTTGDTRSSVAAQRGGLWVTGDAPEGLERLRWIAGASAAELVTLERDGRVKLDLRLLAKSARVDEVPLIEAPLAVTNYIYSNEGLLLLVQLTQARHRYRLHIGRQAPTRGTEVEVTGGINLDNNFDSRINPHRRSGKKMDNERPPDGFDSLVAINPVARWFNQPTNQVVPAGHIIFHEMAEAHAKLELGLDYLDDAGRPGAHEVALQRERRLKSQRPLSGVVITVGSNRVLRSEEEARQFFSRPSGQRQ